jgi:hypothetical protein
METSGGGGGGGGGGAQIKGMATHGGRYVLYNVYGNLFEVSSKYAPPIRPIGRGAYGIVWCVPPLSRSPGRCAGGVESSCCLGPFDLRRAWLGASCRFRFALTL